MAGLISPVDPAPALRLVRIPPCTTRGVIEADVPFAVTVGTATAAASRVAQASPTASRVERMACLLH
jgi:hypothetical protein